MTLAICMKCGARKFGAIVPCASCHFQPRTDEEFALSILFSDNHIKPETLESVAADIAALGGPIPVPDEVLHNMIKTVRRSNLRQMTGIVDPAAGSIPWKAWLRVGLICLCVGFAGVWFVGGTEHEVTRIPDAWQGVYGADGNSDPALLVTADRVEMFYGLKGQKKSEAALYGRAEICDAASIFVSDDRLLRVECTVASSKAHHAWVKTFSEVSGIEMPDRDYQNTITLEMDSSTAPTASMRVTYRRYDEEIKLQWLRYTVSPISDWYPVAKHMPKIPIEWQ